MPTYKNDNGYVFGERLKQLRLQHKETQEELAKILETDRITIYRYENGNTPQVSTLKKIAIHYNVSLDYLCDLIDTPVLLDKIENHNSITKCISRVKYLLDCIEIQYNNENEKNKKD